VADHAASTSGHIDGRTSKFFVSRIVLLTKPQQPDPEEATRTEADPIAGRVEWV
jgi:hypothetical protein